MAAAEAILLEDGCRLRRGALDHGYVRLLLIAVLSGLVCQFSASFPLADRRFGGPSPYHFLFKQVEYALIGLAIMALVCRLSPERVLKSRALSWMFVIGLGTLVLCRWGPWAHPAGGSYCWLGLSRNLSLQPSEFVKVVYLLLLARVLARGAQSAAARRAVLPTSLALMGLMCVGLAIQEDLGMAFLVVGMTLGMLFLGGVNVFLLLLLAVVLGLGGLGAASLSPERWERLTGFWQPWRDPMGSGYHPCLMLAALARGGLGGVTLGMSPDKWGALPTPHTDSIFCVIGGELGFIGAALVLLLFYLLTTRAFLVAERAGTPSAWYIGGGLGMMLGLQALVNIAVATVCIPCTGLTLPFFSYGGSSLISSLTAAGLILAVSRYQAVGRD